MHWQTCKRGGNSPRGMPREEIDALRLAALRPPRGPARGLRIDNLQVSAYISAPRVRRTHLAQVAELVDALVSGTSGAIRGGSSPLLGTTALELIRYAGERPQLRPRSVRSFRIHRKAGGRVLQAIRSSGLI